MQHNNRDARAARLYWGAKVHMTDEDETTTLFRPVGPTELDLIRATHFRSFPPRLPEQPIFYPVLTEEYAAKIARDWNVPASGAGYVTRFKVRRSYLSRHRTHEAGGSQCREYWIPAEELSEFNRNIVGSIEVIAEFYRSDGGSVRP